MLGHGCVSSVVDRSLISLCLMLRKVTLPRLQVRACSTVKLLPHAHFSGIRDQASVQTSGKCHTSLLCYAGTTAKLRYRQDKISWTHPFQQLTRPFQWTSAGSSSGRIVVASAAACLFSCLTADHFSSVFESSYSECWELHTCEKLSTPKSLSLRRLSRPRPLLKWVVGSNDVCNITIMYVRSYASCSGNVLKLLKNMHM